MGVNAKGLSKFLRTQMPQFNDEGSIVNAASGWAYWVQEECFSGCSLVLQKGGG